MKEKGSTAAGNIRAGDAGQVWGRQVSEAAACADPWGHLFTGSPGLSGWAGCSPLSMVHCHQHEQTLQCRQVIQPCPVSPGHGKIQEPRGQRAFP